MDEQHRMIREALGVYVLGHLDPVQAARMGAHLDGCAPCRAEYEALAPLASALRDVDPEALGHSARPAAALEARILAEIRTERRSRRRRSAVQRTLVGAAASIVLVLTFVAGDQLTRDSPTSPVALESVAVSSKVEGVTATAALVDHTWGVEIKLTATGLEDGATYTTTVQEGRRDYAAGEFVGVFGVEIRCNMSASVLRAQATGFTVWDSDGKPVLNAVL